MSDSNPIYSRGDEEVGISKDHLQRSIRVPEKSEFEKFVDKLYVKLKIKAAVSEIKKIYDKSFIVKSQNLEISIRKTEKNEYLEEWDDLGLKVTFTLVIFSIIVAVFTFITSMFPIVLYGITSSPWSFFLAFLCVPCVCVFAFLFVFSIRWSCSRCRKRRRFLSLFHMRDERVASEQAEKEAKDKRRKEVEIQRLRSQLVHTESIDAFGALGPMLQGAFSGSLKMDVRPPQDPVMSSLQPRLLSETQKRLLEHSPGVVIDPTQSMKNNVKKSLDFIKKDALGKVIRRDSGYIKKVDENRSSSVPPGSLEKKNPKSLFQRPEFQTQRSQAFIVTQPALPPDQHLTRGNSTMALLNSNRMSPNRLTPSHTPKMSTTPKRVRTPNLLSRASSSDRLKTPNERKRTPSIERIKTPGRRVIRSPSKQLLEQLGQLQLGHSVNMLEFPEDE